MAKIIHKKSAVSSKIPLVSDLDYGELAINYADGRLYYKTSTNTITHITAGLLTGNQVITISGDASGSGATSIALTLANSGVTAGTYTKLTVDAKGRVTSGTTLSASDIPTLNQNTTGTASNVTGIVAAANGGTGINNGTRTLTVNTNSGSLAFTNASTTLTIANTGSISGTNTGDQTITLTGDVTGSGTGSFTATLANSGVTAGTYTKLTVDAKGRVTSGTTLSASDIPTLNQNTTGTASNVTGTVAITNGGTGATTAANALVNLGLTTTSSVQFGSLGVGIGASGVSGEIRATNNISGYFSSDIRLKTNIVPISNALIKVNNLTGVYFDWSDKYIEDRGGEDGYFIRKRDIGLIAQEVEKELPEIVVTRLDGYKAIKYDRIVVVLVQAIKELKQQVDILLKDKAC